jgi:hypothetical protein
MSAMIAGGRAVRDEVVGRWRGKGAGLLQEWVQKKSRPNLNSKKIGMGSSAVV